MHMLIRAIVPGEDKEEALVNAEAIFMRLVDEGHFDYYILLTDENSRWYGSDVPVAAEVDSPKGKELIKAAMEYTEKELLEHLSKIKDILAKIPEKELVKGESKEAQDLRYYCYCIGQSAGPWVWLYDRYGGGVRTQSELEWALRKENENEKLWVVPADVHF